MHQLQQIESHGTIIVADTGDLNEIKKIKPQDATTNPSLILKAIKDKNSKTINELAVEIGTKISKIIPGYISTEVDPSKSFDTLNTINEAHKIIQLYQKNNVDTSRILIKIAATWQGIKAAEILEKQGIKCNMTLIFSLTQAKACAEAGVTLISPFVGRISDWYKENGIKCKDDPGVKSVLEIYQYYKQHNYSTIIMGASFRNIKQVTSLAGCDKLTISPKLIEELKNNKQPIKSLIKFNMLIQEIPDPITESEFNLEMASNKMATEKLNQGIIKFIEDSKKISPPKNI